MVNMNCGWILDYPAFKPGQVLKVSLDIPPSYGSLPSSRNWGPGRRFISHLPVRARWEQQATALL